MAAVTVDWSRVHEFADADAFDSWLAEHHTTANEVWIRVYKVASGKPSVTPKEAIDVALCWGWIDAIRKSHDASSYLQRYTRRRPRSIWSKINVDNVARLDAAGRMTEHGRREVDAAKADGRWERAYGSGKDMAVPEELLDAVRADPAASATFDRLSAQNRFALAFRLHNLKTQVARERTIEKFVAMLASGKTIYPQRS